MRLVFGSHDHEEYSRARERLTSLVVDRAHRQGVAVDPALVAAALDHRHGVDGRLGHWTRAHVADALAVWFPRTVALLDDDRDAVPAALHALVGFLAERDWLDRRSATPAQLHTQIDDSTPALHDALTDERNLDLGTFWAVQLRRHAVPAADPAAVARFLEQVRRGETDVDREALAEVTRRGAGQADSGGATGASMSADPPPVLLPGAAALLAAAEASEGVRRLRAVTRWVRTGRPLTADGRLLLADARALAVLLGVDAFSSDLARSADDLPETSLLVTWARQARLLRVVKGRLIPLKSAAPLLGRPIELWHRAFAALGDLSEHFGGSNVFGAPSLFGMSLGEALPILLVELYTAGGDPIPLELFHRRVRDAVNARFGCVVDDLAGDVEQRLWRRDVTALVDTLELLGAVTLGESQEHDELTALAGRDDPDPTLVALTPIGLWAARELLLEQGVAAPVVDELADEDLEYVCVRLARVRPEVAEAGLAAWVAARSPREAAAELARLLRRTDDPAHRALAMRALRLGGARPDGEPHPDRTHERAGHERGGHERAGHERGGHERGGHERAGHERAGHERAGHERGGHDRGAQDRSGRDCGSREVAARIPSSRAPRTGPIPVRTRAVPAGRGG